MFDIFVYLFENYVHPDACPQGEQLARKLLAAGFDGEEVNQAVGWLSGLRAPLEGEALCPRVAPREDSLRVYAQQELAQLDADCRSFLLFLENARILDAEARERIIERAMSLNGHRLDLYRLKLIVLMVLWQYSEPMDLLVLDELLEVAEDDDDEGYSESPVLH